MPSSSTYIFTSNRLGFRNWIDKDIIPMSAINADPLVMEYFPSTQSVEETRQFIERMQLQLEQKGFCYYAVERLDTRSFIGFTGLSEKNFDADFTPCIDIGWRFASHAWNKGFATEAAKRCLQHGFQDRQLENILAIAPMINVKSLSVMEKTGMKFTKTFVHPLLAHDNRLKECVLYGITKEEYHEANSS